MRTKDIPFHNLAERQLLLIAQKQQKLLPEINKEWLTRYQMNFPYRLDIRSRIINALLDREIPDEECDSFILKQANELREKRRERIKGYRNHVKR
ncbi:hypothetical protein [Piscibacillus salipiscarius]